MIDVLVVDDDFRVAEINAEYVGQGSRIPGRRPRAQCRPGPGRRAAAAPSTWSCSTTTCPDQTGLELVHRMREQRPRHRRHHDHGGQRRGDRAGRDAPGRPALPGQAVHLRRRCAPAWTPTPPCAAPSTASAAGARPARSRSTGSSAPCAPPPAPSPAGLPKRPLRTDHGPDLRGAAPRRTARCRPTRWPPRRA